LKEAEEGFGGLKVPITSKLTAGIDDPAASRLAATLEALNNAITIRKH
jgi:hypothetical protein